MFTNTVQSLPTWCCF